MKPSVLSWPTALLCCFALASPAAAKTCKSNPIVSKVAAVGPIAHPAARAWEAKVAAKYGPQYAVMSYAKNASVKCKKTAQIGMNLPGYVCTAKGIPCRP